MSSRLASYPPQPLPTYSPPQSPVPLLSAPPAFVDPYSNQSTSGDVLPLARPYPTIKRSGSPTPSEAQELKQLDGIIQRALRKESWKDREFVGEHIRNCPSQASAETMTSSLIYCVCHYPRNCYRHSSFSVSDRVGSYPCRGVGQETTCWIFDPHRISYCFVHPACKFPQNLLR